MLNISWNMSIIKSKVLAVSPEAYSAKKSITLLRIQMCLIKLESSQCFLKKCFEKCICQCILFNILVLVFKNGKVCFYQNNHLYLFVQIPHVCFTCIVLTAYVNKAYQWLVKNLFQYNVSNWVIGRDKKFTKCVYYQSEKLNTSMLCEELNSRYFTLSKIWSQFNYFRSMNADRQLPFFAVDAFCQLVLP